MGMPGHHGLVADALMLVTSLRKCTEVKNFRQTDGILRLDIIRDGYVQNNSNMALGI